MIEEAEERHDGIARLDMLQGARHLPFGGRPAQKVAQTKPIQTNWIKGLTDTL